MRNQFFIVGAQRSATTYLCKLFASHPEICMAEPYMGRELKYFLNSKVDLNEYEAIYNKKALAYGEKSTTYMTDDSVPLKIKNFYPNAKIIFMLRNPITRALSNYFYSKFNGLESRKIEDVFLNQTCKPDYPASISTDPFDYIGRSMYSRYLHKYTDYFPSHIIITERLIDNQVEFAKVSDFIGVSCFVSDMQHNKINSVPWSDVPVDIISFLKSCFVDEIDRIESLVGRIPEWNS